MAEPAERRFVQEFARYYDFYVPDGEGPFPLVVGAHGYGGDKSSLMRLLLRINDRDFAYAALQGPHQHVVRPEERDKALRFGFGWLTSFKSRESIELHYDAVATVIEEARADRRVDASRAFLFGFSQAVALNFRFAFTHPEAVRGVVAVAGGIPGDWEQAGLYREGDFDVLYVGAEHDEFYSTERIRANAAAIGKRARSVRVEVFDTPHEVPRDAYPVVDAWLRERS